MSLLETPNTTPGRAQRERASALVEQVRQLVTIGIKNGQEREKVDAMMAEARRLQSEARAAEESYKADLLRQFDSQGSTTPTNVHPISHPGSPFVASNTSAYPAKAGSHLVVSNKAADVLRLNTKALGETTNAAGGFLVPPQYLQSLWAENRRQGNAVRRYGWWTEHQVDSNQVLLPISGGTATVGIVAENATKPSQDQSFSQLTVNVYTWAGISKVSRQLFMDSNPAVSEVAVRELSTLLGNLESSHRNLPSRRWRGCPKQDRNQAGDHSQLGASSRRHGCPGEGPT